MKRHMFVLLLLACAGCAPVVTKVNVTDIARSDSLEVRDARPAAEKDAKIFSLLITSKEYGVLRAGDARLSPTPVRLLQHETFEKFAASDHLPKVTVYHFVIYENMRSQNRSLAVGVGIGGIIGGLIGNAIGSHDTSNQTRIVNEMAFNSSSDEYLRGVYAATENPDKASVFIIYLDTEIDGRKVFTRTIASMKPHGDTNALADAVQLAIKNHLAQYDAGVTAMTVTAPVAPVADTESSSVPEPANEGAPQASPAGAAMTMAQNVSNQLGCGVVRANGDSGFVAPCGAYEVAIDCDGDRCHPMHTVSMKSPE